MKTVHQNGKKQANFFISVRVIQKLKKFVTTRKQSEFVEYAIEKELQQKAFFEALEKSAGAWKDHPKNVEQFIRVFRKDRPL